jgi:hypothetical protein
VAGNFWDIAIIQGTEAPAGRLWKIGPPLEIQWSGLRGELVSCTDRHRVLAIRSLSKAGLLRLTAARVRDTGREKGNLRRRGGRCGVGLTVF